MLFIVQWSGPATVREAAVERFKRHVGRADQMGVKVLGRWHTIAEPGGYAVVEAADAAELAIWILEWNDLFKFTLTPVMSSQAHDARLGVL